MINTRCFFSFILGGVITVLSISSLLVNYFIYQYPMNNYFPPGTPLFFVIVLLFYLGLIIFFGKEHTVTHRGLHLFYLITVMSLIALATNATQLTPFAPIDEAIIAFEQQFSIDLPGIIAWTKQHPIVDIILRCTYDTLPYQMCLIPLIILIHGQLKALQDYYFLLLGTTLISFTFYYFYPTTAPASILDSSLFSPYQLATGIKFTQLHQHIKPFTLEGGLIAFPSCHTVWALCCTYLVRQWKAVFITLSMLNSILLCSCVLLGWHYLSDIIAGIFIVLIVYSGLRVTQRKYLKLASVYGKG